MAYIENNQIFLGVFQIFLGVLVGQGHGQGIIGSCLKVETAHNAVKYCTNTPNLHKMQ